MYIVNNICKKNAINILYTVIQNPDLREGLSDNLPKQCEKACLI